MPNVEEIKSEVKNQIALANFNELIQKLRLKCLDRCANKDFSQNDTLCLGRCVDRYMEAWDVVYQTTLKNQNSL